MSSTEALDAEGSAWLSDTALSALELREQPFAVASADGETFTDDITAEQLADIRQALITGDDLLLILGERGAGKSTLLAQLAANSGLRVQCFSVSGSPRFSTRNLFMGMLEAFKVEPPEDLKATLDELIPCLQAMIAGNKLCVVVLDDAEALAEHELTTLLSGMLYINSRDESLLRIALSADPAFEERIPDLLPEGADLPYSSLSLEPFDTDRAAAYLGFRLARAGRLDELPFDEDEIAALNERAGGRPGPLHVAAAAALEEAYGDPNAVPAAAVAGAASADAIAPEDDLPPELRSEHRPVAAGGSGLAGRTTKLALGALAGAMIVGGLLLFRPAPEPGAAEERYRVVEQRDVETERLRLLEEEDETSVAAATPATGPDAADEAVEAGGGAATELALAPAEEDTAGDDPAPAAEPTPTPAGDADADAGAEPPSPETPAESSSSADAGADADADTAEADPQADPVAGATPERVDEPVSDAEPELDTTGEAADTAPPDAPAAPAPTAAAEPDADAAPTPAADGAGSDDDADADATDVALAEPDDADPSPVAPPPEEPLLGALESPNWVLVQNPAQYTVQMSASTDRASVEQFLERTQLPAPNSIFSFDRNGRTWYALVHGLYPSVSAARSAIERMPSEALTNQPWIRAVGRIQETLRERN